MRYSKHNHHVRFAAAADDGPTYQPDTSRYFALDDANCYGVLETERYQRVRSRWALPKLGNVFHTVIIVCLSSLTGVEGKGICIDIMLPPNLFGICFIFQLRPIGSGIRIAASSYLFAHISVAKIRHKSSLLNASNFF